MEMWSTRLHSRIEDRKNSQKDIRHVAMKNLSLSCLEIVYSGVEKALPPTRPTRKQHVMLKHGQ